MMALFFAIFFGTIAYLLAGIRFAAYLALRGLRIDKPLAPWYMGAMVVSWLPFIIMAIVMLPFTYSAVYICSE